MYVARFTSGQIIYNEFIESVTSGVPAGADAASGLGLPLSSQPWKDQLRVPQAISARDLHINKFNQQQPAAIMKDE